MEFCAERGLWVGNTYFKHRSLHKFTRAQYGVEVKHMIDLVKKNNVHYVRVVRGMGQGLSDHHVLCKVRLVGT